MSPTRGGAGGRRQRPQHESPRPPRPCPPPPPPLSPQPRRLQHHGQLRRPALPAACGGGGFLHMHRSTQQTPADPPAPSCPRPPAPFPPPFFFFLEKTHPGASVPRQPFPPPPHRAGGRGHTPPLPPPSGLLRRLGVPDRSPPLGSEGGGGWGGAAGSGALRVQGSVSVDGGRRGGCGGSGAGRGDPAVLRLPRPSVRGPFRPRRRGARYLP